MAILRFVIHLVANRTHLHCLSPPPFFRFVAGTELLYMIQLSLNRWHARIFREKCRAKASPPHVLLHPYALVSFDSDRLLFLMLLLIRHQCLLHLPMNAIQPPDLLPVPLQFFILSVMLGCQYRKLHLPCLDVFRQYGHIHLLGLKNLFAACQRTRLARFPPTLPIC